MTELTLVTSEFLELDISGQLLSQEVIDRWCKRSKGLRVDIDNFMQGKVTHPNRTVALHTLLRDQAPIPEVLETKLLIKDIANALRDRQWLGVNDTPITDVVHLGIGGSHLGPHFCLQALNALVTPDINFHFVAEVAPKAFEETTSKLSPHSTLFIIASKSFTTKETLYNYSKALKWAGLSHPHPNHFIAITGQPEKAKQAGFYNILSLPEGIVGRFSVSSAMSLIIAIAIGYEKFEQFLVGAHTMDQLFATEPLKANLPLLMAMITDYHVRHNHIPANVILTYGNNLEYLTPWIQQLEMESNGKTIDLDNQSITAHTCQMIWGGSGDQAQHSYSQLLAQGSHRINIDLISSHTNDCTITNDLCFLMGQTLVNQPYSKLTLKNNSPEAMGALIALYEHKVFAQSLLWHIDPFSQPNIEQMKRQLRREFK